MEEIRLISDQSVDVSLNKGLATFRVIEIDRIHRAESLRREDTARHLSDVGGQYSPTEPSGCSSWYWDFGVVRVPALPSHWYPEKRIPW